MTKFANYFFYVKRQAINGFLKDHYENTPIQIYRKFHLQKLKKIR